MPTLHKNGKILLSGIEQIQIIKRWIPLTELDRQMHRHRSLPAHIRKFEKRHGGYFKSGYERIVFVITNRRKFQTQLRRKRR